MTSPWTHRNAGWAKAMLAEHLHETLKLVRSEPPVRPAEPEAAPDDLPFLSPETWPRCGSYDGGQPRCSCGKCDPCRFYARIERDASIRPWTESAAARIQRSGPRWPSVDAALSWICEVEFGCASTSDFEQLARYGSRIQSGSSPGRSRASSDAEDIADIERCLRLAYGPDNDRGLGLVRCLAILFARRVGLVRVRKSRGGQYRVYEPVPTEELGAPHGLSSAAIGAIVRSGIERLRIEMSGRGLVPMPARSARAYAGAVRRVEELAAREVR